MRTADDIRRALELDDDHEALARLSGFAYELADLPTRPVGAARGRSLASALAAAAAVVLVAAGGVALVQLRDGGFGAAGGGKLTAYDRRPTWNLRVGALTGYTVTRVSASSIGLASGSQVWVASTDTKRPTRGDMTTCPYAFDGCTGLSVDHLDKSQHWVTVNGRRGVFGNGSHVGHGSMTRAAYRAHPWSAALNDAAHQPGISWGAGHHTTVYLHGTFGFDPKTYTYDNSAAKKILLRIASAVSAGHRDATHLPFELNDLPGRVAPERVAVRDGACGEYGTGPQSKSDALGIVFTACRVRTKATGAATIAAADRTESNRESGHMHLEPDHPIVQEYPDGTSLVIAVEPDKRSIVSLRRAREIAANADVSPRLGDGSSWIVVR